MEQFDHDAFEAMMAEMDSEVAVQDAIAEALEIAINIVEGLRGETN